METEREREREREKERTERDVRDKSPTLYKFNGIFFHCILYSV